MNKNENGGEADPKPVVDVFGTERGEDGKPVAQEPVKTEVVKKEGEPTVEDFEKNPLVVELRSTISTITKSLEKETGDKAAMGENLSKLRQRLEKLEKGDTTVVAEPVFKKEEIKRVKDYSAEEQGEMSEREKALIESDADMKERLNKIVADAAKKEADKTAAAEAEGEEAVETEKFNSKVQTGALSLVGVKEGETPSATQRAMANAIIEEFNAFADNDKLTPKQMAERLEKAAKLVPDYKPPKEQKSPIGQPAKPVETGGSEIDKIVEEAKGNKTGGVFSL